MLYLLFITIVTLIRVDFTLVINSLVLVTSSIFLILFCVNVKVAIFATEFFGSVVMLAHFFYFFLFRFI